MFIVPLQNITLRKVVKQVRTFSVTKIFDVTLRRGYAEGSNVGGTSGCGDDGFKAMDVCSATDTQSTGALSHNSLKPPPEISACIFRKFSQADEQLGPGADKCGDYKNAEYYGYHIYSYADILVDILKMQALREKTGIVPCPPKVEKETAAVEVEVKDECAGATDASQEPSKVQMVCSVAGESETKPCKFLPDEHILACISDSEISDDETDCKCKDETKDTPTDACDKQKKTDNDSSDDEC